MQGMVFDSGRADFDIWPPAQLSVCAGAEHYSSGWHKLLLPVLFGACSQEGHHSRCLQQVSALLAQ